MGLASNIFLTIAIGCLIGISPSWTWNVNDRRYDGYDLERGPVFYEAYYPKSNENTPTEYQEKRYFDRDAVIERTFQIPTDRREYVEDRSKNEYLDRLDRLRYEGRYFPDRRFSMEQSYAKMEPSRNYEISRKLYDRARSIPDDSSSSTRDLESWNLLENYPPFESNLGDRRDSEKNEIDRSNFRIIPERELAIRRDILEKRDGNEEVGSLREIRNNLFAAPPRGIQPLELSKEVESMRRLSPRDIQDRNSFDAINSLSYTRYPRQQYRYFGNTDDPESQRWMSNVKGLSNEPSEENPRNIDSPSAENIYAPRPQVINYVFSKDSTIERTEKPITMTEITKNEEPRNYGDNLLQEELNKDEVGKDKSTKVTSIEISEVPRHKIRHHHGEWLRDFSRGQK